MLSIGKINGASAAYFTNQVAAGAEDYYLGAGEAPGQWLGRASASLGLDGAVERAQLEALLAAQDPRTNQALLSQSRAAARKVTAFDLTFSSPKGVTLLAALGNNEVAAAARAAHDQAVREAVGYLQDHAAHVRRGAQGGAVSRAEGLVAAAFRHRSSRTGDPQLHTHVLVPNLAQGPDGQWSSLYARWLYAEARTAGFVYQSSLRAQLTERLGLSWSEVRNGMAEPAGFTKAHLSEFSTRRAEIEEHLAANGGHSRSARERATLATRAPKDNTALDAGAMRDWWAYRAAPLGMDDAFLAGLTGPSRAAGLAPEEVAEVLAHLAGPDGVTAHTSAFERRDVMRALAAAAPDGAHVAALESWTEAFLAGPDIVALSAGPRGQARYTTHSLLALEDSVLTAAVSRRESAAGEITRSQILDHVLADRPSLSAEQAQMVRRLCLDGDGIAVVVGKAGAGKTFALEAARSAWEEAGYRVIGTALSARAAGELSAGAGMDAVTIASLVMDLSRPESAATDKTIIVVDEAGLVGTRDLDNLVQLTGKGKLVLCGDHHQLPEIGAGGSFAALVAQENPIVLEENRRQAQAWERAALDQLRAGSVVDAVTAYQQAGRFTFASDAAAARTALVSDWAAAHLAGRDALMVALRRDDVGSLNRAARAVLQSAGRIGEDRLEAADRRFALGDVVVATRNDRRLGLTNGMRGTVVHIDLDRRSVAFASVPAGAVPVRLTEGGITYPPEAAIHVAPAEYLEAGHLDHGFALTAHKAQGATVDAVFLLGNDTLYREAGYVGLSRARNDARLYAVTPQPEPGQRGPGMLDDLVKDLSVSRVQVLASVQGADLASLHSERETLARRLLSAAPPDARYSLAAAEAGLARVARLTELDRGDNSAWLAREQERAEAARAAATSAMAEHEAWVLSARSQLERLAGLDAAIAARTDVLTRAVEADPPTWLIERIGPPGECLTDRATWRQAAAAVVSYAERFGIEPEALERLPEDTIARFEWMKVSNELDRAAHRLGRPLSRGMEMA